MSGGQIRPDLPSLPVLLPVDSDGRRQGGGDAQSAPSAGHHGQQEHALALHPVGLGLGVRPLPTAVLHLLDDADK